MRTSFGILKRDLLALLKNPIALLVVGALMVLPGLYAWYCIVANWDPYANTGSMPIAVVNMDKGATNNLTGEVNLGQMVIEKLEDNDKIDWRIYDNEEEALEDTRLSIVYATLVLPSDLSENVLGILSGSEKKPTIYYYPNEKSSAVATKVTDSAAKTLIQQINQGFSSTVNEKVLTSTQDIAHKIEEKTGQTNSSALAEIRDIQADLEKVVASLDDVASSIQGWRTAAAGGSATLTATADQLPAIRRLLSQGSTQLDNMRSETDSFNSGLSSSIIGTAATVSSLSAETSSELKQATTDLETVSQRLEALREAAGSDAILKLQVDLLELLVNVTENAVSKASDRVATLDGKTQQLTSGITTTTSQISNEVMPQLNTGTYRLATSLSQLSGAVGQFEPQVDQLRSVLDRTDSALETSLGAVNDAKALLGTISTNLKGTATDIGAIGSALQVDRLTNLLDIDPQNLGTFVSSPVQMVTEKICPVSNYGTAVAPFYTNLALWVACFILVSLIKVEVDVTGFEDATPRQRYFGRWWLFVILSFIQSQVICGVDILLGIDCMHPALFMLSGAVCSFVYMNLIFALVSTFRNVGKTLCILLLIMQVPGSSGMYPIQLMPDFFQFIHPALPFTYGIDAMREALSGLYGMSYVGDLFTLLLIVPISLAIGLLLRPVMANLLMMFDEEMRKTGFFASEEHGQARDTARLRGMMRALVSNEAYADDIEERAWKFNRIYRNGRKAGSIATFAVPFAFLVLMLPFNLTVGLTSDAKLQALALMIFLLLLVLLGLTILEYVHRTIQEETKLIGADILNGFDLEDLMADAAPAEDEQQAEQPEQAKGMVPATKALHARVPKGSPTLDIFKTDMTLGFSSAVGVVVIMLLVITPSLYAWFNLIGSWDPYSNTGNLKVAVANEDEGYKGDLIPVTINIGDTVASQMRGNTNFDWVFVDKDEAVSGVESSKYYAAIEIPKDFSANMMTYLVDNTDYPNVVYYTNEKENPIAPIITQKGADAIQESIRVGFTERVDEVVLSVAYDILNYVKSPRVSDYVSKMSGHLDDATRDTKSASRELHSLGGLVETVAGIVQTTGTVLEGVEDAAGSARQAAKEAESGLSDATTAFDRATTIVEQTFDGRSLDVDEIKGVTDEVLTLLQAAADTVPDGIDRVIERVEQLKAQHPDVDPAKFDAVIASLQDAKQHATSTANNIGTHRTKIDGLIDSTQAEVNEARTFFRESVKPGAEELRLTFDGVMSSTSEVVDGLEGTIDGLGDSTGGLTGQLDSLSAGMTKTADKLNSAATNIEDTKARVAAALKSGNLQQIEEVIMGGDPEVMAASLVTPIQEERLPMYSVANFGSNMAPFYTVLSLWVGALVMISTMRVRIVEERIEELRKRYGTIRPRHEFFGRYGIFGLVGLLQSSLVLLGDLMFLHIQCVNPVMFFILGLFIGQMFCLIVYTITELFGDVGKALCVILLIMQVAASGGTFPAEMLHPILMRIVPFLPFYHAMSMLQECVAGIYWPAILFHSVALIVMTGAMLIIGLPLRKPFRKLNIFLEEQLEKTGYM